MPATNTEFVDRAAVAIGKGLKRMGPRISYEAISEAEALKALQAHEALPRYSSELMRQLDSCAVSAGVKTNAALNSVKSRVSNFARKTGRKYKVFAYQNEVFIVRKE